MTTPAPLQGTAAGAAAPPTRPRRRVEWGLVAVFVGAGIAAVVYLLWGLDGNVSYVLQRRLTTLATLTLVGAAVAVSTVLFQTVTHNRILTPAVMGFDALYILLQTLAVAALGATATATMPPLLSFALQVVLMLVFSVSLYAWLIGRLSRRIHLLVLIGMVFGIFFRSIAAFVQRILDPTEFIAVQDRMFADFTDVNRSLLGISALIVGGVLLGIWPLFARLDVMSLGHDMALSLGVDHRRSTLGVLVVTALLVSVSTALVGPTTFFGLLVAHLGYRIVGRQFHRVTVPAAIGASWLVLIVGQVLLERLVGLDSALAVVVEFLGGIVFLILLTRRPD